MKNALILISLICLCSCNNSRPSLITGMEGKLLPSFDFLLMDSTMSNSKEIPSGKPIVIFYFSPTCPFCRAEIQDIEKNIRAFENVRFYLFTSSSLLSIKDFYTKYHVDQFKNIKIAFDNSFELGNYFNIKGVPYNAIYSSQKRLNQVIPERVNIEQLKRILDN